MEVKKDLLQNFEKTIAELEENDKELLDRALAFAKEAHKGQKRKSKEDYINHPVGVATLLLSKFGDTELTAAALLHDAVEYNYEVGIEKIEKDFGKNIAFLVESVSKDDRRDNLLFLLERAAKDARVLLLKFAEQQDNLEMLSRLKNKQSIRMSFDTLMMVGPLREIMDFDNTQEKFLEKAYFAEFLKEKGFSSANELKELLVKEAMETNDYGLGKLPFDGAGMIWYLNGRDFSEKVLEDEKMEKDIDVVEMEGNRHWFKVSFRFNELSK